MKVLLNKIKWRVWYFVNWLKIKCSSIKELIKNLLTIVVILIKYPSYDERAKKLEELTKRKERELKEAETVYAYVMLLNGVTTLTIKPLLYVSQPESRESALADFNIAKKSVNEYAPKLRWRGIPVPTELTDLVNSTDISQFKNLVEVNTFSEQLWNYCELVDISKVRRKDEINSFKN